MPPPLPLTTPKPCPPLTEAELMARAAVIAGMTLADLAEQYQQTLPTNLLHAKGYVGQLLELALGATAGVKSEPDFQAIGVELKTLPLHLDRRPKETTYVCITPLTQIQGLHWHDSIVYQKLKRVLWLPYIADRSVPIPERQICNAILWSPSTKQEAILRQDWEEHMEKIAMGLVEQITAHQGVYLQIRPKAADSRAVTEGVGPDGRSIKTLPRGFYLRTEFTAQLLNQHYL